MEREMILFKKEITELKLSNSVLKESLKQEQLELQKLKKILDTSLGQHSSHFSKFSEFNHNMAENYEQKIDLMNKELKLLLLDSKQNESMTKELKITKSKLMEAYEKIELLSKENISSKKLYQQLKLRIELKTLNSESGSLLDTHETAGQDPQAFFSEFEGKYSVGTTEDKIRLIQTFKQLLASKGSEIKHLQDKIASLHHQSLKNSQIKTKLQSEILTYKSELRKLGVVKSKTGGFKLLSQVNSSAVSRLHTPKILKNRIDFINLNSNKQLSNFSTFNTSNENMNLKGLSNKDGFGLAQESLKLAILQKQILELQERIKKVVRDKNKEIQVLLSVIYEKYCEDAGLGLIGQNKLVTTNGRNSSPLPENVKSMDNKQADGDPDMYKSPPTNRITTQKLNQALNNIETIENLGKMEGSSSPQKEFRIRVQEVQAPDSFTMLR